MATSGTHRNTTTRTARKIEAPRPLKDSSLNELNQKPTYSLLALSSYTIDSVEKLIALMDIVANRINQFDNINADIESSLLTRNIIHLCKNLKIYGPQLENSIYQGQLDRAFLSFREGMVRGMLEYEARVHLLDIVELRECNWIPRKNLSPITNNINTVSLSPSYQDFGEYSDFASCQQNFTNDSSAGFNSEEICKRPTKLREKSSKSGSKSYCRNEVIIRNSDSGKVPPTAKERIVQITGPNEDKISYATRLIENTIRNNASPVKEFCGSESSCSSEDSLYGASGQRIYGFDDFGNYSSNQKFKFVDQPYLYKHKVIVRNCHLTITGDDYTYVTVAKAILDDYFSKLRTSESPEDVNYCEDVFLNDRILKDEDLRKSEPSSISNASGSGDFKSCSEDFSFSNVTPAEEDTVSYFNCGIQNFPYNRQSDLKLSYVSCPSSTYNDFSFPSELNESKIDEPKPLRTCYTREFLLECAKSDLSQQKPKDWQIITKRFPQLIKESDLSSGVGIEE